MRKLEREILRRRVGNKRLKAAYHTYKRSPTPRKKSAFKRALSQLKSLFGGRK